MSEKIQIENNYYSDSNAFLDGIILKNNEAIYIHWNDSTITKHFLILDKESIHYSDGRTYLDTFRFNPFIEIEHNGTKLKISAVGLWAKRYNE